MESDFATDADLVAETLAGNTKAFGQLYDRYARMVRAIVAGVTGDWPAAEDMTQECFLRAYGKLLTLREPPRFGAWIAGIARQVARERRRSLRRDRHEFRELPTWEVESPTDGTADLVQRDQLELVMRRLCELEERERLAVHAFFLDERDAQQVAELLGLSRSGIYALLGRAIARLARLLQPCETNKKEK